MKPQITPFSFGEDSINAGDVISTQCLVSKGDLPIKITWTIGNKTTGVVTNQVNKRLSTLSIESVQAEHIGEYICTAKNPVGTASFSTILNVNGTKSTK